MVQAEALVGAVANKLIQQVRVKEEVVHQVVAEVTNHQKLMVLIKVWL